MSKKFWTTDKIVALTALFISVLTLIIFIRQTNLMERESRLSAMPYVLLDQHQNTQTFVYAIYLDNHGVGPAIIESQKLLYKGQEYDLEFPDFLREMFPQQTDSIEFLNRSSVGPGQVIPTGGNINVLSAGGNAKEYYAFLALMEELAKNGFNYELVYRSIYDDHWIITGDSDAPKAIDPADF